MNTRDVPNIRIKLLSKCKPGHDGEDWLRLFPRRDPVWGNCRFVFDRHERNYDWLVVYDELPSVSGERHSLWEEELACPQAHTLLITVEPSTIKAYGSPYLHQFRWVLSAQEPWALRHHPGQLYEQPALTWFYSTRSPRGDYDHMVEHPPLDKTRLISTVCSSKQQKHTLHHLRFAFTMALKEHLPELDIFGHGMQPLDEKADALDAYRYHLAIENYAGKHHWTEKLADAFLGACLPFYFGCPNVADYFPDESYIPIDIRDYESAFATIERAIADNLYEQRLPAILESRRLILEKYGPIATICRIVNEKNTAATIPEDGCLVQSRNRLKRNPALGARYLLEKLYVRGRHRLMGQ